MSVNKSMVGTWHLSTDKLRENLKPKRLMVCLFVVNIKLFLVALKNLKVLLLPSKYNIWHILYSMSHLLQCWTYCCGNPESFTYPLTSHIRPNRRKCQSHKPVALYSWWISYGVSHKSDLIIKFNICELEAGSHSCTRMCVYIFASHSCIPCVCVCVTNYWCLPWQLSTHTHTIVRQ